MRAIKAPRDYKDLFGLDIGSIAFFIGAIVCFFGLSMLLPAALDYLDGNEDDRVFMGCAAILVFFGLTMALTFRRKKYALGLREVVLAAPLTWIAVVGLAALPFVFSSFRLSYSDAVFETMSGATATGSTVIVGLDAAPRGLLLWRWLLIWFGGFGFVTLAVLVLPFLRIGGMQLFVLDLSAQSGKFVPRMIDVVVKIALVYATITVVGAIAFRLAGMSQFDAIGHSMAAVATGGFSSHDAGIGYFQSPTIEWIAIIEMAVSAMPFVIFIEALRRGPALLWNELQVRLFAGIIIVSSLTLTVWLVARESIGVLDALRQATFNVVSIITTTGFTSQNFALWGGFPSVLILMLMLVGGCTGSTAGGIKMFRLCLLLEAIRTQLHRQIYPHGTFLVTYNSMPVQELGAGRRRRLFLRVCVDVLSLCARPQPDRNVVRSRPRRLGDGAGRRRSGARRRHRPLLHLRAVAGRRQMAAGRRNDGRAAGDSRRRHSAHPNLLADMSGGPVHVIGGGLAGSEAAWQLARAGCPVVLHEMRPTVTTPAHRTDRLAELVCSNSFRSDDAAVSAIGLLHEEMRRLGSLVLTIADRTRVPAGSALAVDRDGFADGVGRALAGEPLIRIVREEMMRLPSPDEWPDVILATGPLTSQALADELAALTGAASLAFFDAIAPIVHLETIDMGKAWRQSRYDKGDGSDYINCPLNRGEYEAFVAALIAGETMPFHDWERDTPYFEGCLPIEVMAARGPETLRFGPMKPVGLTDPRPGTRPSAVVQLRQDNALGTLYNIVGFQTKLRHGEQVRIFRMIPGLERAEFARLGGIHRNLFVNSPRLLDRSLGLRGRPGLRLAGQMTGCEGYVESAAIGLLAGRFTAAARMGRPPLLPPATTAIGALLSHITNGALADTFQPMNVNFGLFPPLEASAEDDGRRTSKAERRQTLIARARGDLTSWLATETGRMVPAE